MDFTNLASVDVFIDEFFIVIHFSQYKGDTYTTEKPYTVDGKNYIIHRFLINVNYYTNLISGCQKREESSWRTTKELTLSFNKIGSDFQ